MRHRGFFPAGALTLGLVLAGCGGPGAAVDGYQDADLTTKSNAALFATGSAPDVLFVGYGLVVRGQPQERLPQGEGRRHHGHPHRGVHRRQRRRLVRHGDLRAQPRLPRRWAPRAPGDTPRHPRVRHRHLRRLRQPEPRHLQLRRHHRGGDRQPVHRHLHHRQRGQPDRRFLREPPRRYPGHPDQLHAHRRSDGHRLLGQRAHRWQRALHLERQRPLRDPPRRQGPRDQPG